MDNGRKERKEEWNGWDERNGMEGMEGQKEWNGQQIYRNLVGGLLF